MTKPKCQGCNQNRGDIGPTMSLLDSHTYLMCSDCLFSNCESSDAVENAIRLGIIEDIDMIVRAELRVHINGEYQPLSVGEKLARESLHKKSVQSRKARTSLVADPPDWEVEEDIRRAGELVRQMGEVQMHSVPRRPGFFTRMFGPSNP